MGAQTRNKCSYPRVRLHDTRTKEHDTDSRQRERVSGTGPVALASARGHWDIEGLYRASMTKGTVFGTQIGITLGGMVLREL